MLCVEEYIRERKMNHINVEHQLLIWELKQIAYLEEGIYKKKDIPKR